MDTKLSKNNTSYFKGVSTKNYTCDIFIKSSHLRLQLFCFVVYHCPYTTKNYTGLPLKIVGQLTNFWATISWEWLGQPLQGCWSCKTSHVLCTRPAPQEINIHFHEIDITNIDADIYCRSAVAASEDERGAAWCSPSHGPGSTLHQKTDPKQELDLAKLPKSQEELRDYQIDSVFA